MGPAWISGLAKTVHQVRTTGAQVVVLGPTPKPEVDVPDCLSRHLHNAVACTTTRRVAVDAGGVRLERQAVLRAGGSYLDLTSRSPAAARTSPSTAPPAWSAERAD